MSAFDDWVNLGSSVLSPNVKATQYALPKSNTRVSSFDTPLTQYNSLTSKYGTASGIVPRGTGGRLLTSLDAARPGKLLAGLDGVKPDGFSFGATAFGNTTSASRGESHAAPISPLNPPQNSAQKWEGFQGKLMEAVNSIMNAGKPAASPAVAPAQPAETAGGHAPSTVRYYERLLADPRTANRTERELSQRIDARPTESQFNRPTQSFADFNQQSKLAAIKEKARVAGPTAHLDTTDLPY